MVSTKQELLQKYEGTFTLSCQRCCRDSIFTPCKAGDSRCAKQHTLGNDWDLVLAYEKPVDEELVPPTIIRQPWSACHNTLCKSGCGRDWCKYAHSEVELDVWNILGTTFVQMADLVTEPRFLFGEEDNFSCQLCDLAYETEAQFWNHVHSEEHMTCMHSPTRDWACKTRRPPEEYALGLCYYFPHGRCYRGRNCAYAHSEEEWREWRGWDARKRN
ncbi:Helz2, partial [Symbiodinium sp. CCMP2456]